MRFDSQPVPGEEAYPERDDPLELPDDPLELPDDLALMAEQLSEDAQRLASSYPAQLGPVVEVATALACVSRASPRPTRRRDLIVSSMVGGLVALVLLVMFTLGRGGFLDRADRETTPAHTVADDHRPAVAPEAGLRPAPSFASVPRPAPETDSIAALPGDLLAPTGFSGAMPSVTPAVLRSGITGPEMEAWMDLRQDELETDRDSLEF